jgi:hypothetical protein
MFMFLNQDPNNSGLGSMKFEEIYRKSVSDAAQAIFADHPLMQEAWKREIEEALRDVPGLDLT